MIKVKHGRIRDGKNVFVKGDIIKDMSPEEEQRLIDGGYAERVEYVVSVVESGEENADENFEIGGSQNSIGGAIEETEEENNKVKQKQPEQNKKKAKIIANVPEQVDLDSLNESYDPNNSIKAEN